MSNNNVAGLGEILPGDYFQVVDAKSNQKFTLKYEYDSENKSHFKQMGRNTTRTLQCDTDVMDFWLGTTYKQIERVIKAGAIR